MGLDSYLIQIQEDTIQESDLILSSIALIYRGILINREEEAAKLRDGTIGGIILAAIIATAAYKVYKGYLSKAAKACKEKKGEDKSKCMKDYKEKAIREEIKALQSLMKECSKSKDAPKCKKKIQNQIIKKKKKLKG